MKKKEPEEILDASQHRGKNRQKGRIGEGTKRSKEEIRNKPEMALKQVEAFRLLSFFFGYLVVKGDGCGAGR